MRCVLLSATLLGLALAPPSLSYADAPLVFSYFVDNGQDGLHLATSRDGLDWGPVAGGRPVVAPAVGGRLMRDPCVCQGPDGGFHMVWTSSWHERGIGLAHSKDLVHWSAQQFVPVMEHEQKAINCWAPEINYDEQRGQYLLYWSTTITDRFPETASGGDESEHGRLNHRIYATTTSDFKTYAPTRLFYDPGFSVIDATIVRDGPRWLMIVKDETRWPTPKKHLRIATADDVMGPYSAPGEPFTPDWVEGPTAIRRGAAWRVYYDGYTRHRYEGAESADLEAWNPITDRLSFPKGARHGTVFEVSEERFKVLERLD